MTFTNCTVIPRHALLLQQLATMTKCCQPFPRGLMLLLGWYMQIFFSCKFTMNVSFELLPTSFSELKGWLFHFNVLCVLLPVVGWVGDSMLGRYRVIIVGFFLLTVEFWLFWAHFSCCNLIGLRYQQLSCWACHSYSIFFVLQAFSQTCYHLW